MLSEPAQSHLVSGDAAGRERTRSLRSTVGSSLTSSSKWLIWACRELYRDDIFLRIDDG
jgi:hypothetical protein